MTGQFSSYPDMASEPVAWLVLADGTDNVRIWWRDKDRAEAWSQQHNKPLIPLYAEPRVAQAVLPLGVAQRKPEPSGYRAAWLELLELCNTLKADRFRLEQTIRDSIDALERNSTNAPVVECLKAALPSTARATPQDKDWISDASYRAEIPSTQSASNPYPDCPCKPGKCIYPGCTCAFASMGRDTP